MDKPGKNVYFFDNAKTLKNFVGMTSRTSKKGFHCVSFRNFCREHFREMDVIFVDYEVSNAERDVFLNEYKKVVRALSSDRLFWNATDIASCNRFTSPLPCILEEIFIIEKTLSESAENLLVVGAGRATEVFYKTPSSKTNVIYSRTHILKNLCGAILAQIGFLKEILIVLYKKYVVLWLFKAKRLKRQEIEYCIKSFAYDSSFKERYRFADPFFGELEKALGNIGKVCTIVNVAGNFKNNVRELSKRNLDVYPVEFFLGGGDIFLFSLLAAFYTEPRRREVFFCEKNIAPALNFLVQKNRLKISLYQLLHYAMSKNLLKYLSIKKFIYTYENNPWEKMCIASFKKFSPETELVGYQHAVLPLSAVNVFSYHSGLSPDKVLTTGKVTADILKRYADTLRGEFEDSCALRYSYLKDIDISPRTFTNNILVVLEGVSDASQLVDYAVEELSGSGYRVTFRFHPVFLYERMRPYLKQDINKIPNIKISRESDLKKDITDSDMVVYWGSTIALEAVLMGKFIINYDNGRLLNNDPLFELNQFKRSVKTKGDLSGVIEEIHGLSNEDFYAEREKALKYLKEYFYFFSTERLNKFL